MTTTSQKISDDPQQRIQAIIDCQFAVVTGLKVIRADKEEVRLMMDLRGKLNGFGTAHGGAIFALADQAFAIAANREGGPQVALSASINYLKPAVGVVEAVARKVAENGRTSVYEVLVYSGEELVAVFQGVGYKLRKTK
jgi:acyl-CoA thioesterase